MPKKRRWGLYALGFGTLFLFVAAASFWLTSLLLKERQSVVVTQRFDFSSANPLASRYLVDGWLPAEPWGAWATASPATVQIPLPSEARSDIKVVVAFRKMATNQSVTWSATGSLGRSKSVTDDGVSQKVEIEIGRDAANAGKALVLKVAVVPLVSPRAVGVGNFDFLLGIGIESAEITWSPSVIYSK